MNSSKAIELLEKGEARMVVVQTVLLSAGGKNWLSFDGNEWEETESELVKKEIE